MIRQTSTLIAIGLVFLLGLPSYGSAQVQKESQQPIYKLTVNVVERTTTAINYRHRSGATALDFRGTPLLPEAYGQAKVESKQGYIEIEVEFDELQPATRFGPEYLTYVMWAITPEGRATNLGEVILNGSESKLNVTSELQAFGLIVTAEPYFAVSQPSDVVVMENFVRDDTKGKIEEVNAKFELLQRGVYVVNVPPADLKPIDLDKNIPLDLYQARNALRVARWAGADKDAADSYSKANSLLEQAEAYQSKDSGSRAVSMTAREAVQTAEDARLIALKRQEELRLEAAANREAQAVAEAEDAARLRVQAEQERNLEAERRARAEADRAAAEAATARARMEAELAAERAARERESIASEADQARKAVEQAEREKAELRQQLVRQLNLVLETRDSARGLIVNMSDVLFDTARYNLRPGAREKLAKISGIVLSHPGLILEVEGHTDSVGTDEYNMELSGKRANSVRDFLIQEGINSSIITARGFGESQPVTTNDTATGRQQNRRVELVVSGEVIGSPLGPNTRLTPGNQ